MHINCSDNFIKRWYQIKAQIVRLVYARYRSIFVYIFFAAQTSETEWNFFSVSFFLKFIRKSPTEIYFSESVLLFGL